ncbi:MAG: hypothetical protein K8T90_10830 [Planctomycetes bacterium]|nr:hypothetical protein [Planctomycetota bacterium]
MTIWMVVLAVVVGIGVVAAFAPFFGPRTVWDVEDVSELDALFDAKSRVLRAIKDLDHEHEAGLLSEADWTEARAEQVAEAVRLNREIASRTGLDTAAAEQDARAAAGSVVADGAAR